MKLFIAEKPSLAQAIAAGIGVGRKLDGYISVNGGKEIVTWCYGHILVQLNPDEYAEKYRAWRMKDLPIVPSVWKMKVKAEAAEIIPMLTFIGRKYRALTLQLADLLHRRWQST